MSRAVTIFLWLSVVIWYSVCNYFFLSLILPSHSSSKPIHSPCYRTFLCHLLIAYQSEKRPNCTNCRFKDILLSTYYRPHSFGAVFTGVCLSTSSTPIQLTGGSDGWWGVPLSGWQGNTPIWPTRGIPPSGWWGTKGTSWSPVGTEGGIPHQDWMGYPHWDWMGVHPSSQDWMGYPLSGLDGGTLPIGTGWGTPPPFPSGDSAAEQALAMWQAVCLLRSHRRTLLFLLMFCVCVEGGGRSCSFFGEEADFFIGRPGVETLLL